MSGLEKVRQDGLELKFVMKQTPEICMEAVKQNGWALKFVKDENLREKLKQELETTATKKANAF